MRKMLRSMILLVIILGSAVPEWSMVVAADPGDFAGGDGSAGNPYQIADWYHLDKVRDHLGDNFILLNDLDSLSYGYEGLAGTGADSERGWLPIGTVGSEFTGSLDGRGYEIRDLVIDRTDEDYVGLFGYVGSGGVIEDLGVAGASVTGNFGVGGLVGWCDSGTVSNCYATGSVLGINYVGGLVGYHYSGTVSNCYATGSVLGMIFVGGLVGSCSGPVSNCCATGSVTGNFGVGGLVGLIISGTVSNCYSTGSVTGDSDVGGLVGNYSSGTVSNCFWDTETSVVGSSPCGAGKTTAQMQDIATFTDTSTTGLDSRWNMVAGAPGVTYPYWTWNIVDGEDYPFLTFNRVQIKVSAGWNMVSVPAEFCGGSNTVENLFGDEIVAIYTWDPESKSYTAPTVLEPFRGYWIAVMEDKTITLHV